MNKKYIHFFGCSFTVGHELPDNEIFPWIKDCKTDKEYYEKFISFPKEELDMNEYINHCKSMSYPKIIEGTNSNWQCINHAELGSSIKQEAYKIISLIEKKEEVIDYIAFQVPSFTREFAINSNEELKSHSINYPSINDKDFNEYLEKSIMFHSINHWTLHGLIDLLLLQGYLLSKNIKFLFIDLEGSNRDVGRDVNFWTTDEKYCLNLQWDSMGRTVGNHFNLHSHQNFARILSEKIKETI